MHIISMKCESSISEVRTVSGTSLISRLVVETSLRRWHLNKSLRGDKGAHHEQRQGKSVSGIENLKCTGQEADKCLMCS